MKMLLKKMKMVLPSVKLNQTLIHDFLSGFFFFFWAHMHTFIIYAGIPKDVATVFALDNHLTLETWNFIFR